MSSRSLPWAAACALLLLPGVPPPADAAGGVLRCQRPDGSSVYTNHTACSRFGADAAPLPAALLGRILDERRREAVITGLPDPSRAQILPAIAGTRRDPADGCATSARQLARDLAASLAEGDVNRVAESFHWAGMTANQARPAMDRLDHMAGRDRLADAEFFPAGDGHTDAGLMQIVLVADGTTRIDTLPVLASRGCYFLRLA